MKPTGADSVWRCLTEARGESLHSTSSSAGSLRRVSRRPQASPTPGQRLWSGAWCWERVIRTLAERGGLRATAIDLPGHGGDASEMTDHPVLQRILAKRSSSAVEWPTGHSPFLSDPGRVAGLLTEVAEGS